MLKFFVWPSSEEKKHQNNKIKDDSKKYDYCFKFAKHVSDNLNPSSVAEMYQNLIEHTNMRYKLKTVVVFFGIISDLIILSNFGRMIHENIKTL